MMLRLGTPPPKKKSTVSDTGLSLCTDQMIDFVPEMGDFKLALKGKRGKSDLDTGLSMH